MAQDRTVLKEGSFYAILDGGDEIIMEDRTKRGLQVRETSVDGGLGVIADKGMIHDMDGIGHAVPVRWYFPKESFGLGDVVPHAEAMESKYTKLRELTCPDD